MIIYPIVKIKTIKDIDNHVCQRINPFLLCNCIFEFYCPKCKAILQKRSIYGAKRNLTYGCSKCCPKKHRISGTANIGERQSNKNTTKYIGDIGEDTVGLKLEEKGYRCFFPKNHNVPYIDMFVQNPKNQKHLQIQVKASLFNHNNCLNNNGYSALKKMPKEKIFFDFLIVYLINYNTFWIISKKDLLRLSVTKNVYDGSENVYFRVCVAHIGDKKDRYFPFQDAWHLLYDALK